LIFAPPVAVILAVAAAGLSVGFFVSLANEIDENREAIVCAIYNAADATEAYDNFETAIRDLAIDLGLVELEIGAIADLVMQMAPIDTFNKLYQSVGLPSVPGTTIDCADCADRSLELVKGSGPTPEWDTIQTFDSTEFPYEAIALRVKPDGCAGELVTFTLRSNFTTTGACVLKDCSGSVLDSWSGTTNWTSGNSYCGASFEWNSQVGDDFSISIEVNDNDCTP
jgi:hypothetical protein